MSRPYFEMKVVKVKKQYTEVVKFMGKKYKVFVKDGKVSIKRHKHQAKGKSNWVNEENLDKIKFPCFCSYRLGNIVYGYGEIIIAFKGNDQIYKLINIDKQTLQGTNVVAHNPYLKDLIKDLNIHILKGKVIIFEEE